MKILVTGASGMVGTAIKKQLSDFKLILTDKRELDVTDYSRIVLYGLAEIDLIIHLAAETDLETCERNPQQAYFTNTIGCANISDLAKNSSVFGTPIFYISTAGIFDGTKESAYTIHDIPNPINHYGRSKWLGEIFIKRHPEHYILRASWMMGGGPAIDKKFINKIYQKILNGETEIMVYDDVFGSPTYTKDLANSIKYMIINKYPYGVYNCAGEGRASRYEVAKEMIKLLGLQKKIKIIPIKSEKALKGFYCPRSKNEALENYCMPMMRPWKVTLKEYINDYFRP